MMMSSTPITTKPYACAALIFLGQLVATDIGHANDLPRVEVLLNPIEQCKTKLMVHDVRRSRDDKSLRLSLEVVALGSEDPAFAEPCSCKSVSATGTSNHQIFIEAHYHNKMIEIYKQSIDAESFEVRLPFGQVMKISDRLLVLYTCNG